MAQPRAVDLGGVVAATSQTEVGHALLSDGTTWTWGNRVWEPAFEFAIDGIGMDSSGSHSCAVASDHTLWCWGTGTSGQLGDDRQVSSTVPVQVGTATDWRLVTTGVTHTCGIREPGILWCWGANGSGQLGDSTLSLAKVPVRVATARTDWQTVVASGANHTCALAGNNTLWCWGNSAHLQNGRPGSPPNEDPAQVGSATTWTTEIGTYQYNTCAIQQGGTLYCWGREDAWGSNATSDTYLPQSMGTGWLRVGSGTGRRFCGVKTTGLYCWGAAATDDGPAWPYQPAQVSPIVQLGNPSMYGRGGCMAVDGAAWCWGTNDRGIVQGAPARYQSVPYPLALP